MSPLRERVEVKRAQGMHFGTAIGHTSVGHTLQEALKESLERARPFCRPV